MHSAQSKPLINVRYPDPHPQHWSDLCSAVELNLELKGSGCNARSLICNNGVWKSNVIEACRANWNWLNAISLAENLEHLEKIRNKTSQAFPSNFPSFPKDPEKRRWLMRKPLNDKKGFLIQLYCIKYRLCCSDQWGLVGWAGVGKVKGHRFKS